MIDNKTSQLALPLPNKDNLLIEDVYRLIEAITTLDMHVAAKALKNDTVLTGTVTIPATGGGMYEPTTRQYVDALINTLTTDKATKLNPTFTGEVLLPATSENPLSAATRAYVDSVASGLAVKASCRCATTANIVLAGIQTIDGIAVVAGDRVLVKNQTTAADNGIYIAAAGAWTRSEDMNAWIEVSGAFTFIEVSGGIQANTGWAASGPSGGTIGSTAITWNQFAGAGSYTAGTGIQLVGTQFSVSSIVAQLTAVQTLTNKTINAAQNTIQVTPAGNLAANELNAALQELQTDIDGRQPLDADLSAIAALSTTGLVERTGNGTAAITPITSFVKSMLDDPDAPTVRATLGLGTASALDAPQRTARRPAFLQDFLNNRSLDPRITYTRGSTATRVNAKGWVERVLADKPRYDWDPLTQMPLGLLVEESRTNLAAPSETLHLSVGSWVNGRVSLLPNMAVAPDGTITATKVIENYENGDHYLRATIAVTSGKTYTMSFFAKAGERQYVMHNPSDTYAGAASNAAYDLVAGTAIASGAGASATITPYPNGWWRCTHTFAAIATGSNAMSIQPAIAYSATYSAMTPYQGDGVSGFYLWGVQFEEGPWASSYIPTPATFASRNAAATFVGANGLIQTAAANVARTEYDPISLKQKGALNEVAATNFIQDSQNFATNWALSGSTFIEPGRAVAPDGTYSASRFGETATTPTSPFFRMSTVSSGLNVLTAVFSIFVKAGERTKGGIRLDDNAGVNTVTMDFDLVAETATNVVKSGNIVAANAGIQKYANGWYRVFLSVTLATQTEIRSFLRLRDNTGVYAYTGDGVSGLYVWGAQLEAGSYPTSYVPNIPAFTSRSTPATYYDANGLVALAQINQPRSSYDSLTKTPRGLILEPLTTNLLTYSEAFDNAIWVRSRSLVTANATTAPDGTLTADKLIEDTTATNSHAISQTVAGTASTTYTASVFLKAGERYNAMVRLREDSGAISDLVVNLQTGALVSGAAALINRIQPLANGWYRVWVTGTTSGSATNVWMQVWTCDNTGNSVYTGDGVSGLYVWGAQLEQQVGVTSYYPTTNTSLTRASDITTLANVTRAADVLTYPTVTRGMDTLTIDGARFLDLHNFDQGTYVVDATVENLASGSFVRLMELAVNGAVTTDNLRVTVNTTPVIGTVMRANGVDQATLTAAYTVGQRAIVATSYKTNEVQFSLNGAAVQVDNDGAVVPQTFTALWLGCRADPTQTSTRPINGHLRKFAYYPDALSGAELPILSQP